MAKDNRPEILRPKQIAHPVFSTTMARVEYIVSLMRDGKFRRGRTPDELGSTWSLGRTMIDSLCSEASRVVYRAIDLSVLASQFHESIFALRRIADDAEDRGQHGVAAACHKTIVDTIVAVLPKNLAPAPSMEQRTMTKDLIAKGWTPPMLPGLPSPELEDENEDDKAGERI